MMSTRLLAQATSLYFIALHVPAGMAAEIVQDQHWPANSDGVWEFSSFTVGSIVDVGVTGKLTQIDLYLSIRRWPPNNPSPAADLLWTLRSVKDGLPPPLEVLPLAYGLIPGSSIGYEPLVSIDLSSYDLFFEQNEQFALCLTPGGGSAASFLWWSYRGADAPRNRGILWTGLEWRHVPLIPISNDPPYSAGFSTFVELVPEPSSGGLAIVAILVAVGSHCRGCRRSLVRSAEVG